MGLFDELKKVQKKLKNSAEAAGYNTQQTESDSDFARRMDQNVATGRGMSPAERAKYKKIRGNR